MRTGSVSEKLCTRVSPEELIHSGAKKQRTLNRLRIARRCRQLAALNLYFVLY